ncbi:glycoside hydrolase family 25 protein [Ruminococcus sp. HUN007]|uniref:glycoside hydrolase family 25 protein n=1 Tax=Ruminococcus sp. HUN007 TaxID=1514668 RepID=UPI0018CC3451|nr:glycoside hydrolase family 25 protein [Ruminococcus sp. HUN007]
MRKKTGIGNTLIIIAVIAAAAAVLLIVLIVFMLSGRNKEMPDPGPFTVPNINVTFSKLDRTKFYRENGFINYSDSEKTVKKGVDVSYAQKEINWPKVKAAGIDYAMVRAGFRGYESGKLNVDDYYHRNMKGAQDAGLETGVYFFSQATSKEEAEEEARFVLGLIKDYNITCPVAYDWEPVTHDTARTDSLAGDELCECALAFCRTIEENGYKPIIYASLNLLRDQFNMYDLEQISGYDLWLAEYKEHPEFPYEFSMWQYTDEGKVDGIINYADLNLFIE